MPEILFDTDVVREGRLGMWLKEDRLPDAAEFVSNFLGRHWFDAKLPPWELLMLVRLLVALYAVQKQGLVMSKKDVMKTLGAEHVATATRYTDLAIKMGLVRTQKAKLDTRLRLLFLTSAGEKAVERELEIITQSARWLLASRHEYRDGQGEAILPHRFEDSITSPAPKAEELSVVNDDLIKVPSENRSLVYEMLFSSSSRTIAGTEPQYRPLRARRWADAYGETLAFDDKNIPALVERARINQTMLGDFDAALIDIEQLIKIDRSHLPWRARVLLLKGDSDRAIADIDQHLQSLPVKDAQTSYLIRAEAYARKREWQKAAADIDAAVAATGAWAVAAGPKQDIGFSPFSEYLRGVVLANVGRIEDATWALKRARDYFLKVAAFAEKENTADEPMTGLDSDTLLQTRDDAIQRAAHIDEVLESLRAQGGKPTKKSKAARRARKKV